MGLLVMFGVRFVLRRKISQEKNLSLENDGVALDVTPKESSDVKRSRSTVGDRGMRGFGVLMDEEWSGGNGDSDSEQARSALRSLNDASIDREEIGDADGDGNGDEDEDQDQDLRGLEEGRKEAREKMDLFEFWKKGFVPPSLRKSATPVGSTSLMDGVTVREVGRGVVSESIGNVSVLRIKSRSGTIVSGDEGDADGDEEKGG